MCLVFWWGDSSMVTVYWPALIRVENNFIACVCLRGLQLTSNSITSFHFFPIFWLATVHESLKELHTTSLLIWNRKPHFPSDCQFKKNFLQNFLQYHFWLSIAWQSSNSECWNFWTIYLVNQSSCFFFFDFFLFSNDYGQEYDHSHLL